MMHYCAVRKKSKCQKFYSLTIGRKQQKQQPAPVYEDIAAQSQNIELKENIAYGPFSSESLDVTMTFKAWHVTR